MLKKFEMDKFQIWKFGWHGQPGFIGTEKLRWLLASEI